MTKLYYSPALGPLASLGLLVLRLVAGLALMLHGWPKIQHPFDWMGSDSWAPGFLQALAALAEFGGGLCLILGLFTPVACLLIMATMLVAIVSVHLAKGDVFVKMPGTEGGSFEPAALYFAIALMYFLTGPGKYSLDFKFFNRIDVLHPSKEEAREKVSV